MSGWIRESKPRHRCEERPEVKSPTGYVTGVWRCERPCFKLWVYRAGWSFLKFQRTAPRWRRANLWESSRWFLAGFATQERLVRNRITRIVNFFKGAVDRMRVTA